MEMALGLETTKSTFHIVHGCGKSLGHVQENQSLTTAVNICRRADAFIIFNVIDDGSLIDLELCFPSTR